MRLAYWNISETETVEEVGEEEEEEDPLLFLVVAELESYSPDDGGVFSSWKGALMSAAS